jgi:hypothetical protein
MIAGLVFFASNQAQSVVVVAVVVVVVGVVVVTVFVDLFDHLFAGYYY